MCTFPTALLSQNNEEKVDHVLEINGFLINTRERTIYHKVGVIIPMQNGGHADGYRWEPATMVDFHTTSLIFMGGGIFFKEFLPDRLTDLSSFQVIYQSIGKDRTYSLILSPKENRVYEVFGDWAAPNSFDVSDYTHIRQTFFKNESGNLYCISPGGIMSPLHLPLDEGSLQMICSRRSYDDNFFTDKNGLYRFKSKSLLQLESSNDNDIQPVMHEHYFVYGNSAYVYDNSLQKEIVKFNVAELSLINTPAAKFIADKNQSFELRYNLSIWLGSPVKFITEECPPETLDEWKYFDIITVGDNLKENTLYYPSPLIPNRGGRYAYLIETPSGFYGLSGSSLEFQAIKYDDVMIYNIEIDDYESIEIEHFRRLSSFFYIYKGQLYYSSSHPVDSELDVQNLKAITLNGIATEFYTDGTFLIGGYNLWNKEYEEREGVKWYKFKTPLFRDVDWESLQVVNKVTMVDKNNIYQVYDSLLKITPIKDLILNVIIVPQEKS